MDLPDGWFTKDGNHLAGVKIGPGCSTAQSFADRAGHDQPVRIVEQLLDDAIDEVSSRSYITFHRARFC
jgi:hypothetical protein